MIRIVLYFLFFLPFFSFFSFVEAASETSPLERTRASLDRSLELASSLQEKTDESLERCDAILEEIRRLHIRVRRGS